MKEREDTVEMGTIIGEGITFDDVLLVPQYSEVTPNMINLSTQLTKNINERGNGYCYRAQNGNCHGKTGRYWYYS